MCSKHKFVASSFINPVQATNETSLSETPATTALYNFDIDQ
jgi:hypothetical protein